MTAIRNTLVVFSNAVDGQADELTAWYDDVHLPEIVELEGFTRATRMQLEPVDAGGKAPWQFMVIYEVAGGRLEEAKAALARMRAERKVPISPSLAPGSRGYWYSVQAIHES
ncbi:DUF4286 family protein [Rhodococcus wratislaviensis]|uniref:EthD domain-containing protein n=1 Tax=Rhodococcus wratislaviensis NBRC 100605 TaxID=1219028 RepID=X0Q4V4_RHOWR|nr:DUF4286 family protein [Rhodococcus wratislaviensis]GAF45541.1 hypothetical protein RW1_022_01210 [Rhodococcus wratislaviensis NBRC 100605]